MNEGKKNGLPGRRAARVALSVSGVLTACILVLSVACWTGWWNPGFGWLSAKLAAKAVVGVCMGCTALVVWIRKRG
ncbi:hypothetical protein [Streptomyces sp. NPDC054765]